MPRNAYLTLLTKKEYLPGVLVLHKSLVDTGSKYPLVVMATPDLPQDVRDIVARRGIDIVDVEPLYPKEGKEQLPAHDIRFWETWTKLRMFSLEEYDRLVALDADMVVRRSMDELMDLDLPEGNIAAGHACACNPRKLPHYPKDWIPENCAYTSRTHPPPIEEASPRPYHLLNSGLVVLRPSREVFDTLHRFLEESPLVPTFKFPDQDLLAAVFRNRWTPLPWHYNALKTLRIIHAELWRDEEVRCVHYILSDKPWRARPEAADPQYVVLNRWWWEVYEQLREEMGVSDPEGWKLVEDNVAPA
ncbi:glycosyltransferase family 8 protein [Lenzites betulinus]|nr:glycosyltransferase family 8 protein [Lenzites betulinus]